MGEVVAPDLDAQFNAIVAGLEASAPTDGQTILGDVLGISMDALPQPQDAAYASMTTTQTVGPNDGDEER